MNTLSKLYDKELSEPIPAIRWMDELLDRRVRFMARRFDNRVALLLVSLSSNGKLINHEQSEMIKDSLIAKVEEVTADEVTSVMMVNDSTIAIVIADITAAHKLKSLVNRIVQSCSVFYEVNGEQVCIEPKGGLSTPLLPNVEVSSLIPFSRLALTQAEVFKVAYYPDSEIFLEKVAVPAVA